MTEQFEHRYHPGTLQEVDADRAAVRTQLGTDAAQRRLEAEK